ncbi:MAG: hypothetical protein WCI02_09500 [Planctomycetota bacterium]
MIRWIVLLSMVCLVSLESRSQTPTPQKPTLSPEKLGYLSHNIDDPQLGTVNYYVRNPENDPTKPLILYLDGSGPYPLYQRMKQGFGSTVLIQDKQLLAKFNLVLISKPGVPFVDDIEMDKTTGMPNYDPPEEYTRRLSLDWRVDSAKRVIEELLGKQGLKPKQLIVVGISEGFQVGAKPATIEPRITHVGLFVGNGLNQFYDFTIAERMKAERGEQSPTDTQVRIENLIRTAQEIYAEPEATEKNWMGHTYKRWASFTSSDPLEFLLEVKSPIFVACCSLDKNTSIVSADYIPLEFAKRSRTNLTYRVYPYEHSFIERIFGENGQATGMESHFGDVFNEFVVWLETQGGR